MIQICTELKFIIYYPYIQKLSSTRLWAELIMSACPFPKRLQVKFEVNSASEPMRQRELWRRGTLEPQGLDFPPITAPNLFLIRHSSVLLRPTSVPYAEVFVGNVKYVSSDMYQNLRETHSKEYASHY